MDAINRRVAMQNLFSFAKASWLAAPRLLCTCAWQSVCAAPWQLHANNSTNATPSMHLPPLQDNLELP